MTEWMYFLLCATFIGTGATLVMDGWALFVKHVLRAPTLNYALLGRWIGHLARGRFSHDTVATAPPLGSELWIGRIAHYAIGVVFAALLLATWGVHWARNPTLAPALITGLVTLTAPFLIMQPSMGFGVAASRMPNPRAARAGSIAAHIAYGVGLYGAASVWALLIERL